MSQTIKSRKKIIYTGVFLEDFVSDALVFHQPMIKIIPVNDYKQLDYYIDNISRYNWLIFTSRFSVIHFWGRIFDKKLGTRVLNGVNILAVGETVADYLKKTEVTVDYVIKQESIEDIINFFSKHDIKDKRILIPGSPLSPKELPNGLRRLAAVVDTVVAYQNVKPDAQKLNLDEIDEVYFLSPWGFNNFLEIYKQIPKTIKIKAVGKPTQDYIKAKGYNSEIANAA